VVERVVVNTEGEIERVDLLPPFAYLREVCEKVSGGEGTSENPARIETGDVAATCSSKVLECEPDKTQSELHPKYKTAIFLQQLIFPQNAHLVRLSNKH
jgi:hypothetical protein